MDAEVRIELGGEPVLLLGERALYWPAGQALLIADLHLGKADVFRRSGIALPAGGTRDDLQRLDALVRTWACRELWILGDILHGPVHRAAWYRQWLGWRESNPQLEVHVVPGNHDRQLPAAGLEVEVHGESAALGPFLLRHDPRARAGMHVLAGHLHPQVALPGLGRKLPAFWLREGMTVLPAFSRFTAGVAPLLQPGERMVACTDGLAVALPPA